jgi:glycosyltransferase involved in cell wall biosynthesis
MKVNNHLASIILPVHNQADHLEPIIRDFHATLQRLPFPYELLLVLNGCSDNSLEIAQSLASSIPEIRIFAPDIKGWGAAVREGLRRAQGDILCYTNSARTNAKDLMLFLMYAGAYKETVIKASRRIRDSMVRAMGSLLFNIECRAFFDLSCWDVNGTPKVFPRSFIKLLNLEQDGDLIDLEFNLVCRKMNYPILEVPVFSPKRHGGKSTTKIKSALKMYWGAYKLKNLEDLQAKAETN